MFKILGNLSTRVKTALVLFVLFLIIAYIDSYFLFWLVFGVVLMVAVREAKMLYGLEDKSIYIYVRTWYWSYGSKKSYYFYG